MSSTNNHKRKFNDIQLQLQYDMYIAKKLQEEEQIRYENLKKIEQDDFELAKKLQEEENQRNSVCQEKSQTNGTFSIIDLTESNKEVKKNSTFSLSIDPISTDKKRKVIDIIHSPSKKQKPNVLCNSNNNKDKNFNNNSNDKVSIKIENEKKPSSILKKRENESDNSIFTTNKKVKFDIIEDEKLGPKEIGNSKFNLNHQPKKETTNSILIDVKTKLLQDQLHKIKSKENVNGVSYNDKKVCDKSPNKNVSGNKINKFPGSIKPKFDNNLNNKNDKKLLSDNNTNTKALVKGKIHNPILNDTHNFATDEMLIEQLQREEVLFNSLNDNPFLPPTSNTNSNSKPILDKVQLLILEQERLLQEYNRKRKGKDIEHDSPNGKELKSTGSSISGNYITSDSTDLKKFNVRNIRELDDPCPDLHSLFLLFNAQYFHHKLDSVEVRWSKRMTLCAGICYYYPGGYCSVRLSEPLLKFRTRDDFINTLLHEMIHAYLFLTEGNKDHDGHGESFHRIMYKLNRETGSNITVFHNFHDEVNHYRTHVWRCNGPCRNRPPFFGYVRRSMNRKPQKADSWWRQHQLTCGGEFIKISEPEEYTQKKLKKQKGNGQTISMVNHSLLNQPSSSNLDTFNRLKTINTTVISKPKPKSKPKPLSKPKPKSLPPPINNTPKKPDLPFKTKIFDPHRNKIISNTNPTSNIFSIISRTGNINRNTNSDSDSDGVNNDNKVIKNNFTNRCISNIHGFGELKNNGLNHFNTSSGTGSNSNIHGLTNLYQGKKPVTTTGSGAHSNIHGFDQWRNLKNNRKTSTSKTVTSTNTTSGRTLGGNNTQSRNNESNIHGFFTTKSTNSSGNGNKKKKNSSIYDFLKKKK